MPNWCLNEVRFHFEDEETRDEFLKSVEDWVEVTTDMGGKLHTQKEHSVFRFAKILPEPKHIVEGEGIDRKFVLENGEPYDWYSWRNANWGTKWEPDIISFDREDETTVYIEMYTAWSPPEGIYNALMGDWEDKGMMCSWFYREDGMQFAGWLPD